MYSDLPPHWCRSTAQTRCSGATWSGQRAELPSRRCGSRSRVGSKHFRCPRQRIVSTQKNQYNTDTNTIHFRKKILAKLEEGQSIRAVAQHFEMALLHKPISKGLFHNIIFKWISRHLKFIAQPIGLHITEHSWVVEILPFGLILLRNGMPHQKANKDEIKLTPTQLSNAA